MAPECEPLRKQDQERFAGPPMNPAVPIDLQTGSQRLLRADEPPCYGLSVGGHDFPDGRAVALPRDTVDAVTGCNLVARQGYRLRSN